MSKDSNIGDEEIIAFLMGELDEEKELMIQNGCQYFVTIYKKIARVGVAFFVKFWRKLRMVNLVWQNSWQLD